jgi:hypothetical protein
MEAAKYVATILLLVLLSARGAVISTGWAQATANPSVSTGDSRVDFLLALARRESGGRKDVVN